MKIPLNVRKLKPSEFLRKGDWFFDNDTKMVQQMSNDNDLTAGDWPNYSFFRRKHTAKKKLGIKQISDGVDKLNEASNKITKAFAPTYSKLATVEKQDGVKHVYVRFQYPSSEYGYLKVRDVQVISMDETYLTGLEKSDTTKENGKYKWSFKKFLRSKIPYIQLIAISTKVPGTF